MAIQKAIQKSGILSPWRNPLAPGDRFYLRRRPLGLLTYDGVPFMYDGAYLVYR